MKQITKLRTNKRGQSFVDIEDEMCRYILLAARIRYKGSRGISSRKSRTKKKILRRAVNDAILDHIKEN